MKESQNCYNREQRLLVSAFYEMAMDLQRVKHTPSLPQSRTGAKPTSFLGRKRLERRWAQIPVWKASTPNQRMCSPNRFSMPRYILSFLISIVSRRISADSYEEKVASVRIFASIHVVQPAGWPQWSAVVMFHVARSANYRNEDLNVCSL